VEKHYATNFLQLEMHVDKLQLIATSTIKRYLGWFGGTLPHPHGQHESSWMHQLGRKKAYWYVGVSSISLFWIMVQFSFILNLKIYLNYDIFDIHCKFQLIDAAVDSKVVINDRHGSKDVV
jgi:hypothetical protein